MDPPPQRTTTGVVVGVADGRFIVQLDEGSEMRARWPAGMGCLFNLRQMIGRRVRVSVRSRRSDFGVILEVLTSDPGTGG